MHSEVIDKYPYIHSLLMSSRYPIYVNVKLQKGLRKILTSSAGRCSCKNDNIYLDIGSNAGYVELASAEVYSRRTDTWRNIANMSTVRHAPGAVAIGNNYNYCVYAVGGVTRRRRAILASAERYCSDTDEWQPIASMKHARYLLGAAGW